MPTPRKSRGEIARENYKKGVEDAAKFLAAQGFHASADLVRHKLIPKPEGGK